MLVGRLPSILDTTTLCDLMTSFHRQPLDNVVVRGEKERKKERRGEKKKGKAKKEKAEFSPLAVMGHGARRV